MSNRRKVCYISGTRADFGLMQSTLQLINQSELLELSILVTGMHLLPEYGSTVEQIAAANLPVTRRIEIEEGPSTGGLMARNIGRMLIGFTEALESLCPDIVQVLGDRGEMLAGALAAIHLGIPVVHIHGGERSGTIDEPVRHAVSKLAHYHFVTSEDSRSRLIRMGEVADHVHVVGAPGLDGLEELVFATRETLCAGVGLNPTQPIALLVYHPVLQEAERSAEYATQIVQALREKGVQVMALKPNSDAGSEGVRAALEKFAGQGEIKLATHLSRPEFISWMAATDMMVGNSSSGIIEAATFGTPVINIGTRQNLRLRNANVIDVGQSQPLIAEATDTVLKAQRFPKLNLYGDGRASERITKLLGELPLGPQILYKCNSY
jgi:GDP/UDP-N,N'-diacetylbacillosamine 2-epimerase (hydrolysing)